MKFILFIISFLFIFALQGVLSTEAKVSEATAVATNEATKYYRGHRGHLHRYGRHHCRPVCRPVCKPVCGPVCRPRRHHCRPRNHCGIC